MNIEQLMLIDIETVPQVQQYGQLTDHTKTLWNKKVANFFANADLTPEQTYTQRAGILAEFGKIICIGTAFFLKDNDGKITLKQKTIYNHDEKALLVDFLDICQKFETVRKDIHFVGHNIKEFDIPYISRRMYVNQIPIPTYLDFQNQKPWETKLIDTMHWWRFGDYKHYTSLELLAHTLNIPTSKSDIDGSMVADVYYNDNDLARIAKYCANDVKVVAQLLMRYTYQPLLTDEDIITS